MSRGRREAKSTGLGDLQEPDVILALHAVARHGHDLDATGRRRSSGHGRTLLPIERIPGNRSDRQGFERSGSNRFNCGLRAGPGVYGRADARTERHLRDPQITRRRRPRPLLHSGYGVRQLRSRGFRLEALDYLLKPIDKDRLAESIGRARKYLIEKAALAPADSAASSTKPA